MHIVPHHKRQDEPALAPGLVEGGITVAPDSGSGPFTFDASATGVVKGVSLVSTQEITITEPHSTSTATPTPTSAGAAEAASASSKSELPLGVVIGICVGAFIGLALFICLFYAWYKRSTDKMSAAARRNAAAQAEQHRVQARSFNRLDDSEKPRGDLPLPSPNTREQQESDEKNFSMFKKSPSIRTAYTSKTADEENTYDLPQLEFTKYHPTLAQELSLEHPDKPFAAAAAAVRQNSGVSWDGETVGDDSFLSMRSVRVESGTMSPTMVMAKMTPPATASALHRWESAEVLNTEEHADAAQPTSRNPFAEMAEERRSRSNNPFFNAQETNRQSRAMRSRSNSRTSRTSRAQSLVRGEGRGGTNPFLDLNEALPTSMIATEVSTPATLVPNSQLPTKPSVPSGSSASAFGSEHAIASLIAALDLSKEEVQERLRVVSMQGSTFSAYSEDDAVTVREFPLPPGTTAARTP
ncbi:hypothetical protein C8Q76DRAFT_91373 [Earliella scabrosa]|nr:hypothetical protein C8Q76DRAFT_91373 [Earliella scabrosa]